MLTIQYFYKNKTNIGVYNHYYFLLDYLNSLSLHTNLSIGKHFFKIAVLYLVPSVQMATYNVYTLRSLSSINVTGYLL